MLLPVVCCVVVPLFVPLAPWSAGGGDREDVALSYVYAYSGCVAQPAGCVSCELVCVCVSLVRVVIICPASTHTAIRVGVQSEPGCSSPSYIHTSKCAKYPFSAHSSLDRIISLFVCLFRGVWLTYFPPLRERERSLLCLLRATVRGPKKTSA